MPGASWAGEPAAGPFWVAQGAANELFIADANRNAVSWLDVTTGAIGILAGSATCGFAGDGGAAMGALLCFPEGMALSKDRRLFIADTGNNRIRVVDLARGTITTVAGNGEPGNFGDGGQAVNAGLNGPTAIALDPNGNLYIADAGNNCIRRVDANAQTITTWATPHDLLSVVALSTE
jgi:DNA-binding beta-propeller fold protein YncE